MATLNQNWWQSAVIYQIYPRSFQDSDGDGTGDLAGITQRLDYLKETLGIDAIWLSPFFPSPMADFGYDVSNYVDVDPLFGTLQDFDELVSACHVRNLKVIIDYVPNHTSEQHAWFKESRSSSTNAKRDWYVWRDAKADGSPPNNWLSVFGGPAWQLDEASGQYYLHSFLPEQPDLNWRNPALKAAMFDVLRFWLDRGVDGFRMDVLHYCMKDPALRDNPIGQDPGVASYKSRGDYDLQIHVHDRGHDDIHDLLREMRAFLDTYSTDEDRVAIGEIRLFDWHEWSQYYGSGSDELHMPFNFALIGAPFTAADVRHVVDELEAAIPPGAWPNYVLGNHDESRVASRLGQKRARLAMMLLLTLRGTPTLYYGDELGMEDVSIAVDEQQDPWGQRVPGLALGRDPERTPMQWNAQINAGFCDAGVRPWLPVGRDSVTLNVKAEYDDTTSLLTLTRQLLALRKTYSALTAGKYSPLDSVPATCIVFLREHDGEQLTVALNFSEKAEGIKLPQTGIQTVISSTDVERLQGIVNGELVLNPLEGVVVSRAD